MLEAPYLTTKRLVLKPLRLDDSNKLAYLLHPEIQRDAGPFMPHTLDDLPKHVERLIGDTTWLITLNGDTVIGDIGVFSKRGNETGEIAYYINPQYWRTGYATEAGAAVIDYMFSKLKFIELTALTDSKNTSSRRLVEKLGFHLNCIENDSNLHGMKADVCLYSINNPTL